MLYTAFILYSFTGNSIPSSGRKKSSFNRFKTQKLNYEKVAVSKEKTYDTVLICYQDGS